ncbi:hypothetical protein [Wolbachia endosymbiont (group A) of Sphecodes monilicornis]|uniref:hypothetical protein n=1 Tax=Wolbachia endosymbiont (group A) of Sphecodes monilicornis TaxID=2954060 RepID=UPI00222718CB|nr:hypothetical protein [Wolbachia endosymbiont (group A) of Sphecodes monilicornis]
MLLAFNLLIIIYPYPITSGLLWKELYMEDFEILMLKILYKSAKFKEAKISSFQIKKSLQLYEVSKI